MNTRSKGHEHSLFLSTMKDGPVIEGDYCIWKSTLINKRTMWSHAASYICGVYITDNTLPDKAVLKEATRLHTFLNLIEYSDNAASQTELIKYFDTFFPHEN